MEPATILSHVRIFVRYKLVTDLGSSEDRKACIMACEELLEESESSRYHPIVTLVVMADALDDWQRAEGYRLLAEEVYGNRRRILELPQMGPKKH